MKEYNITMRKDGSAVIAKDYWYRGNDFKHMTENPYLFEVGMKIVDPWGNIVTISQIDKRPSVDGRAPQWTLNVEENGNTYVHYEIAGIFVKELSADEVNKLLK